MGGSTIGGIVGGIAGAVIGSAIPGVGTAIGWTIGSTLGGIAGGMLDPTIVQQPGLNDKKLQTSSYGTMIGYVWGQFRTAGSVTWIGNNGEMVEHEESSGGKGGGSEVQSKSYTASWQITFNKSTRKGQPALVAIDKWWTNGSVVNNEDINPTVYTGWALQLPDSSMEADLGVGEVSADRFKGTAVFNEVQMAQFNNGLPQLEALLRTKEPAGTAITQVAYNNEASWTGNGVTSWTTDWAASETLPNPTGATFAFAYVEIGILAHRVSEVGTYVYANGSTVKLWHDFTTPADMLPVGGAGPIQGLGAGVEPTGAADFLGDAGVEAGRFCQGCSLSVDGKTLVVITSDSGDPDVDCDMWHRIVDGVMTDEGGIDLDGAGALLTIRDFGVCNRMGSDPDISGVYGAGSNVANTLENNGQYIWQYQTGGWGVYAPPEDSEPPNPLSVRLLVIDPIDGVLKQYILDPVWQSFGGPQSGDGSMLCTEEGYCGVITDHDGVSDLATVSALYTRRDGGAETTLAEILSDVFELKPSSVGDLALTPDRYDVSAAEVVLVHGANFGSQMQKRNFVAMLEAAYNFDIVESDDGEAAFLKVVFRGGTSVATIPDDDLGVHDDGEGPKPLLELLARIQDWELPARVNVQHYDPEQDYQLGSQFAQRAWPYVDNVTRIDLPIVMSANEARSIAKRELYRAHLERETYGISTSRKWAYLEPTDVITIQGRDYRITKKTETPTGVVRFELLLSAPFTIEQDDLLPDDGQAAEGATPNPPSGPPVTTESVLMDMASLSQTDPPFGFRWAAGPSGPGRWTGAALYKSLDEGETWGQVAATNRKSVIGTVAEALTASPGSPPDDVLTVTLTDEDAELSSCTPEALANGANLFALQSGPQYWELCQFMTATLIAPRTYEITVDVRGVLGSDTHMTHAAGDTFVLLDVVTVDAPKEELNLPFLYKAVTFGMTLESAETQEFTNTGELSDDWHETVDENLPSNGAEYWLGAANAHLPSAWEVLAGTNITLDYDVPEKTVTINATGGGGGGVPDIDDSDDIEVEPIGGSPPTSIELHLTETGVGAGTYGSSIATLGLEIDAKGRIHAVTDIPIVGRIQTLNDGASVDPTAIAINYRNRLTAADAGAGVTVVDGNGNYYGVSPPSDPEDCVAWVCTDDAEPSKWVTYDWYVDGDSSQWVGRPAGPSGADGPTGTTGATGPTGATGATGSGGTPGGSTTQVQFNNAGAFGGSASFTWSGTRLSPNYVTLAAGAAAAGSAPLIFTTGPLLTSAVAGAVEFLTDKFYATIGTGTARKELALWDAAATSGRVPYVTTNGRLIDASTFVYSGVNLTISSAANSSISNIVNAANGTGAYGEFQIQIAGTRTGFFTSTGSSWSASGIYLASQTNVGGTAANGVNIVAEAGPLRLVSGGFAAVNERLQCDANGNVSIGTAALATTATNGFLYIPTCAGPPTGVPTTKTGRVPMIYDTTNDHLYLYRGGWKKTTVFA